MAKVTTGLVQPGARSVPIATPPNANAPGCKTKYGPNLLRADIRKDRPGRSGASRTYLRETETRTLF